MKEQRKSNRRRSRELALSALYMIDVQEKSFEGIEQDEVLEDFLKGQLVTEKVREYATKITRGALENRDSLDEAIEKASENWKLARIARIDRSILRLAVFELFHEPTVPPQVCINEAVDLAKRFGGEDSSSFINGVLDKIRKDLEKQGVKKAREEAE